MSLTENCILCCTKQVMLQNTGSYDALCDLKHRLKVNYAVHILC